MGNVPPVSVLFEAIPLACARRCAPACARGRQSTRLRGCKQVAAAHGTPFANIDAMVRAVDEIGWPPHLTGASA